MIRKRPLRLSKYMNTVLYYILYLILFAHALLPLRVLYVMADILYVLVYRIIGYRLKVVRRNLKASFPDKLNEELERSEKEFYHFFCDYIVETIKLLHISDEEMQKRMVFENVDLVKDLMKDGNSGLMFLGHYCNWEWVPSLNLHFRNDKCTLGEIYKPLRSKAVDRIFLKIRGRFGSVAIPKNDTLRSIITLNREGEQMLVGFMADQTPSGNSIHYWTNFLNQDTPVFNGVERIAKKTGFSVTYLDMQRIKRGYYVGTIRLVSADPKSEPEDAITEKYIRMMEASILRNPACWLWTHKRWKIRRDQA